MTVAELIQELTKLPANTKVGVFDFLAQSVAEVHRAELRAPTTKETAFVFLSTKAPT